MRAIVNVSPDWGIGFENRLLFAIPEDLRRFRQLTEGGVVICGRKTLETFPGGRPLKNRRNLILTHDPAFAAEGAETVQNLQQLFPLLRQVPPDSLWVIGGESVYRQLLPYCSGAAVTKTYADVQADRFFPNLDTLPGWELRRAEPVMESGGVSFQFLDYVNLSPLPL